MVLTLLNHIIRFEHDQTVWMALNDYRTANPADGKIADFSDSLIIYKAKYTASVQKLELTGIYTFDIAALRLPGTQP
jgi:uncharacterized protein YihD (DUF1040 family)